MYCINCGTKNEEDSKFCIKCGKKLEDTKEIKIVDELQKNNGSVVIITIVIIISIALLGVATMFIYKDFFSEERKTNIPTKDETKENINNWEISYKVPKELEKTSDSETLKMYKYNKDGLLCSLYIWKIDYILEEDTEESLITKYSNIYPKEDINVTTTSINGKEWKYLEQKDTWNKYEYGRFSKDKKSFYSIRTTDYNPEKGKCKKLFDQVINSISYK